MGDLEKAVFGQRTFSGWDLGRCPHHRHVIMSVDSCPEVRKVEICPVACGWQSSKPFSRSAKRVVVKRACKGATSRRLWCHCDVVHLPTNGQNENDGVHNVSEGKRQVRSCASSSPRWSHFQSHAARTQDETARSRLSSVVANRASDVLFRVFPGLYQHFEKHVID